MLFISHSSSDFGTVTALIDLLRSALAIPPEKLRCTSLDGYLLPGGTSIDDRLRQEVHEAEAFIGLISYRSLESIYVVFELGARWGAGKPLIPLLAPGIDSRVLEPPLSGLNALCCTNAAHLQQLVAELASSLTIRLHPASVYQREIDKIVALAPAPAPTPIPNYLRGQLQSALPERKAGLPGSQKQILDYLELESNRRASIPQGDLEAEFGARLSSVYWRLETLCLLGFVNKEVTDFRGETPTYNYRLSDEYRSWVVAARA